MSFISRRIAAPPGCPVPLARTVLRREDRDAFGDATDYAQAVRSAADTLVAQVRDKAASLDEQTSREYAKRLRTADAALVERAVELEAAYRASRDALTARLETTLDAALEAALTSLAATLPPAERMRICAHALSRCAGAGSAGCLYVSPADATALGAAAGTALPWRLLPDAAIAPGACRLSVEDGAWEIKWESIVQRFVDCG